MALDFWERTKRTKQNTRFITDNNIQNGFDFSWNLESFLVEKGFWSSSPVNIIVSEVSESCFLGGVSMLSPAFVGFLQALWFPFKVQKHVRLSSDSKLSTRERACTVVNKDCQHVLASHTVTRWNGSIFKKKLFEQIWT